MAEVTAKEHKHSKKRPHEDGTDEKSEKKHKKSKTVLEEQEVETPLAADTPTVTVPDESSPKKHKKKSKKKDRHKDRGHKQHEKVDMVTEANEDSGVTVPIEPQPEQTKTKKDKSKKKKRAREEENNVDPDDEASKSASSARNVLDEADVTEPTQPEKKKKKEKSESGSKNKNGENETEVDQHEDALRPTSTLENLEASNSEDILQAFQQLDLARLHGVLGDLDLQPFGLDITPDDDHFQPTTTFATNGTGKAPRKKPVTDVLESKRNKRKPVVDLKNLVDPNAGDPHSNLLATKWLSSKELQNLARTEGLVYKKGKFSFTESHAAKTAVEQYRTRNGMTEDAMVQFIFTKHQPEHKRFWTDVAQAVPGRPLQAVYHHVKLAYNPLGNQGRWIPAEDAALRRAVADLGTSWSKVSQQIGRTAQDCKDRWRNHLSLSNKQSGKWAQEELDELNNIIRGLTVEKGKDLDSEIYWGAVSLKMGGRRSREQCRDKWQELRLKMDNENIRRWSKHNTYVLLQRMAALPVNDESEIVWNDLIHGKLNLWTAHRLRSAWKRVEESVPGHENMAYKDVVTSLLERYEKYAEPKLKPAKKKIPQAPEPKSAEVIEDSVDEEGSEN